MHKLNMLSINQRLFALAAPAVVAVLVGAAPRLALAFKHELCLRWRVDAVDRTGGNLAETAAINWPARGTRVRVTNRNLAIPIANGRTNTTNGCFAFQTIEVPGPQPPDFLRNVRVFYDTRVGTPARIPVRGFFTQDQESDLEETSILIKNVKFTKFNDGIYRSFVNVGEGFDAMSIAMASVSHTLHRVDTAITDATKKPAAPPLLKVILQNCGFSPASKWSCTDTDDSRIFLTPDAKNGSTTRKFVSAHESGHWLDFRWGGGATGFASTGGTMDYNFEENTQPNLAQTCRFTWVSNGGQNDSAHAMRSQEHQTGAVREAFAHFMALFAFNVPAQINNPGFIYYKTEMASDKDGAYPADDIYFGTIPFNFPSFMSTPFNFLIDPAGCDCSAHDNCGGTSTELQWMRAYWWYLVRDEPLGQKPTMSQFFGQMKATPKSGAGTTCHSATNRCFRAVLDSLPEEFKDRWENVGNMMGLQTDKT